MQEKSYRLPSYRTHSPVQGSIVHLPIDRIYGERGTESAKNRNKNIRLQQNIRKYGLSSPITVRPVEVFAGEYHYRVTEGEELWRAASLAGLDSVPCRILPEEPQHAEVEEMLTKLRAKRLHFLDQAALLHLLVREYGLTQGEIAARCGFSQSAVANKLRLMHFDEAEMTEIRRLGLSERHARSLLRLSEPQKRATAIDRIASGKLTVSDAERLVEGFLSGTENGCEINGKEIGQPKGNKFLQQGKDASLGTGEALKARISSSQAAKIAVENTEAPLETPVFVDTKLPMAPQCQGQPSQPHSSRVQETVETSLGEPLAAVSAVEFRPQRFILHTLQPLYNSLERTLTIFRKTGRKAFMQIKEHPEEITISIQIPTEV